MILELRGRHSTRRVWGLLTPVWLLAWGGFVLTGAAGAAAGDQTKGQSGDVAKEEVTERVNQVIERISQHPAADVDGSGEASRPERTAFMMAVVMEFPEAVMAEFPYADYDEDGELSFLETYDFIRGNTLGEIEMKKAKIAYKTAVAEHGAESVAVKEAKDQIKVSKINLTHAVLDSLEWLLDEMPGEPTADHVAYVSFKVNQFEAEHRAKDLDMKLAKLRQEVQLLRTKAAEVGGEKAAQYEAKAAELEAKIAAVEAKKPGK